MARNRAVRPRRPTLDAAHYSDPKAGWLLGLPSAVVASTRAGEIDYDDLTRLAARIGSRPVFVVANIGSTMTEAVNDVAKIHHAVGTAGIIHRYVHGDATLAGVSLSPSGGVSP